MSYFQVKTFSKGLILSLVYKVPVQFTFFLRELSSKMLRTMRQAQLSGIRHRGTLMNRPVRGVTAYLLLNILIYTLASYKLISPNTQTPESIMEFFDVWDTTQGHPNPTCKIKWKAKKFFNRVWGHESCFFMCLLRTHLSVFGPHMPWYQLISWPLQLANFPKFPISH